MIPNHQPPARGRSGGGEGASRMSDDARTDMYGRPCRVELINLTKASWVAHVHVGNAVLRSTRVHFNQEQAERQGERWLAKYLETGSWTEATDWHERNYWGAAS